MTTLTIEIPEKETAIVKEILKKFKVKIKDEQPYNPEFVEKILQGEEDIKNGKGKSIKIEDLWK